MTFSFAGLDPADPVAGARAADALGLEPLPGEGGLVRRTHAGSSLSCALYAVVAPDFSALHTLDAVEVYHWLGGAAMRVLLLHPGGTVERVALGPPPEYAPQLVVPPGVWQGSRSAEGWSLVGLSVVPPFETGLFRLGERSALQAGWPTASAEIKGLTRA